jgi:hypothetical protein
MKKLTTIILCAAFFSAAAIAQSAVKIGNLEFSVRNIGSDTLVQITVDEPLSSSENNDLPKPKPKFKPYTTKDNFFGIGFILPDNGSSYYTILGGNSINIDIGGERRHHLSRWFALGGTLQYSFYNYKFRGAATQPEFNQLVLGGKDFTDNHINKQVFRSHNLAAGVFTRFYLAPLQMNNKEKSHASSRLHIDLGAQGDWAFSRYCMLKTEKEKKNRYHEDHAFKPFNASAVVRIGGIKILNRGKTTIYARYRFTEAFNSPKELPMDLPPVTIGLQLF